VSHKQLSVNQQAICRMSLRWTVPSWSSGLRSGGHRSRLRNGNCRASWGSRRSPSRQDDAQRHRGPAEPWRIIYQDWIRSWPL